MKASDDKDSRTQAGLTIPIVGTERARPMMAEIATGLEQVGHRCPILLDPPCLGQEQNWTASDIAVSILSPIGEADLISAPGLRGIVSPLLGHEWIDLHAATAHAVAVVNGEVEENRESMAEATILLLLGLLYRLPDTIAQLDGTGMLPRRFLLKGKTVGIIGYGGIAKCVISRLLTWGCRLIVYTRTAQADQAGVTFVPLEDLLTQSDAVLVLTKHNAETHHLLNSARLSLMKSTALLVNTARGGIVKEADLVDALENDRLAGAALDVFETEPLPSDSPLRRLKNVILTPHSAGHTEESLAALPAMAIHNTLTLAAGRLPTSCRNSAIADRWSERWAHGPGW